MKQASSSDFAKLLQQFFCDRLMNQLNISEKTIASYRDSFRLLLLFLKSSKNCSPSNVTLEMLDIDTITSFLQYLEEQRNNSIRTRNNRLAAIRSFMDYVAVKNPTYLSIVEQIRSIPMKRFNRPLIGYLSVKEINAILNAPSLLKWSGRRDRVMFLLMYNTGARVSEIVSLKLSNISLKSTGYVSIHGKGRKDRVIPLWKRTIQLLKKWIKELDDSQDAFLFPGVKSLSITRSGVEYRLKEAIQIASEHCPSLAKKRISPHVIRHTTAMHLLQSGIDITVIALWLGHENPSTTHMYIEADLALKKKALETIQEPGDVKFQSYKPTDELLNFLNSL